MKGNIYDELILKLTMATISGKISWEANSSKNGFQVKIGKNSVTIVCCDSYKVASLVGGEDGDIQSGKLTITNSRDSVDCYSRKKIPRILNNLDNCL